MSMSSHCLSCRASWLGGPFGTVYLHHAFDSSFFKLSSFFLLDFAAIIAPLWFVSEERKLNDS